MISINTGNNPMSTYCYSTDGDLEVSYPTQVSQLMSEGHDLHLGSLTPESWLVTSVPSRLPKNSSQQTLIERRKGRTQAPRSAVQGTEVLSVMSGPFMKERLEGRALGLEVRPAKCTLQGLMGGWSCMGHHDRSDVLASRLSPKSWALHEERSTSTLADYLITSLTPFLPNVVA